ncbi:MAG: S8 family serine peptidase, partial [Cryobacterium sp.]|nr:S8 family serine peptidase [Cryobacterium sp.]
PRHKPNTKTAACVCCLYDTDCPYNTPGAAPQSGGPGPGRPTKNPGATLDVIVTVIQPDGSTLISQDTGNGETFSIFFPQQGTYTIRVTGFDDGSGPDEGPFTLRINQGSGVSRVTSDFNVLFFRPDTGAFLGAVAENNLATNRPIELPGTLSFPPGLSSVQMVISRANVPSAPIVASRLRYKFLDSSFPSEYFSYSTPITYGHNSAVGANGVAAYSPFTPNIPEDFTSTGPVRIVFDRNNNRIPEAQQVRLKPDMAAMDGGNTTFFVSDTGRDLDTFPNFFGTSAAAPTAAAIAALVLQKNGGPGSVSPAQMKTILQRSAFPHDLDAYSARGQAVATNRGKVTVTIDGDNSITSQGDPNAMSVSYVGPGSIASILFDASTGNPGGGNVVNTSTPGQVFDIRANNGSLVTGGQPFVVGSGSVGLSAANVTATVLDPAPAPAVAGQFFKLQLSFTPGAFTGGKALRFGIDRDEFRSAFVPPTGDSRNGSSADLTGQAVRIPSGAVIPGGIAFTGTLSDGSTFRGVIANRIGAGWSFLDGFGFINAESAVGQPLP